MLFDEIVGMTAYGNRGLLWAWFKILNHCRRLVQAAARGRSDIAGKGLRKAWVLSDQTLNTI